jgi:hypothetical protein
MCSGIDPNRAEESVEGDDVCCKCTIVSEVAKFGRRLEGSKARRGAAMSFGHMQDQRCFSENKKRKVQVIVDIC